MKEKLEKLMVLVTVLAMGLVGVAHAELVAYWKLDETDGKMARDSSGNGHDGTLLGGLSFDKSSTAGVIGRALHFDGSDDGIFARSFFVPTDSSTIALWFNPGSTLSSDSRRMNIVYWGKGQRPCLAFNRLGEGEIGLYVEVAGQGYNDVITTTKFWKASTWYHLAVTFDGADFKVYVNGKLENTVTHPGSYNGASRIYLGADDKGKFAFEGKLDDIRIYSGALTADEIVQLRPDPELVKLVQAVREAEAMIKQSPQKAITFLEKRLAESEQCREKNPKKYISFCGNLSFDLYFMLAKAKHAADLPKKEVESLCKCAFEQGIPPLLTSLGSVLLWSYENVSPETYEGIVQSLIQKDRDYFRTVAVKAEMMVLTAKSKAAADFLEANLSAYAHWREKYPIDDIPASDRLPELYFWLAKAREAVGAPKNDIADAYSKTFGPSNHGYVPQRSTALAWLLENDRTNEYTLAINSFTQARDVEAPFRKVVDNVCKYLESKKSWVKFEQFLDALFAEAKYTSQWITLVESCISDKGNRWGKAYFTYIDDKPELVFARDCVLAEKYMLDENFERAAELYRDIINRCGPEQDKALFEFQLLKCLFYRGGYQKAGLQLARFISRYKATHGSLVKEAMLIRGRALVQLGEPDKALESFSTLRKECPETKNMPETDFFVSYCHMLQGNFKAATEAFDCLIRDHPDSPYAGKARMCVTRIKNITESR